VKLSGANSIVSSSARKAAYRSASSMSAVLKIRVGVENLLARLACGTQAKEARDRKPKAPNARLARAHGGINGNARKRHSETINVDG
jgi:hypothetical protein